MGAKFLASDVYPVWFGMVREARRSIWILTPYLDQSIVPLIKMAGPEVESLVVTDLEPEAGPANYGKKLLALKELLEAEIEVLSLSRLHAKVLVVDGMKVVAGSQNFTWYARQSKEVSVMSGEAPDAALVRLAAWVELAQPVDIELVERLIDATDGITVAVDRALSQLQARVVEEVASREARLGGCRSACLGGCRSACLGGCRGSDLGGCR